MYKIILGWLMDIIYIGFFIWFHRLSLIVLFHLDGYLWNLRNLMGLSSEMNWFLYLIIHDFGDIGREVVEMMKLEVKISSIVHLLMIPTDFFPNILVNLDLTHQNRWNLLELYNLRACWPYWRSFCCLLVVWWFCMLITSN